jgi:hypothetical protein
MAVILGEHLEARSKKLGNQGPAQEAGGAGD